MPAAVFVKDVEVNAVKNLKLHGCSGRSLSNVLAFIALSGILLSASTAAYQNHSKSESRKKVVMELLEVAMKQHRWFEMNAVFSNIPDPFSAQRDYVTADGQYLIQVNNPRGVKKGFVLVAIPVTGTIQSRDVRCNALTVDHNFRKGITGMGPLEECWQL